jgi:hypothetical protein
MMLAERIEPGLEVCKKIRSLLTDPLETDK